MMQVPGECQVQCRSFSKGSNTCQVNFGGTQIDNQHVGENWVRDMECSCTATPMNDSMDNQGDLLQILFHQQSCVYVFLRV